MPKKKPAKVRKPAVADVVPREYARAAREAQRKEGPTAQDRLLAAQWFPLLRDGRLKEADLARLLSAVRYDVAYVEQLESQLPEHERGTRPRG